MLARADSEPSPETLPAASPAGGVALDVSSHPPAKLAPRRAKTETFSTRLQGGKSMKPRRYLLAIGLLALGTQAKAATGWLDDDISDILTKVRTMFTTVTGDVKTPRAT